MTESVLDILKLVLLAMLYLFFARVLWAVWSQLRPSRAPATVSPAPPPPAPAKAPKGTRRRAARLVVVEPKERKGATWPIGEEISIGREETCTITLPGDGYVSGLHARVFVHDGQPMIEDLGSTNGTFHNGTKLVGTRLLHTGDRVQIGFTVLEAQ